MLRSSGKLTTNIRDWKNRSLSCVIYFLPAILAARTSLTLFQKLRVSIGPVQLNLPAALSSFIFLTGILSLLFLPDVKSKLFSDRISRAFLIWCLLLIPWVILTVVNFGTRAIFATAEWIRLFSLSMIYLLIFQLVRQGNYQKILNILFLSLIAPLGFSFYQVILRKGYLISDIHRVFGSLPHPNSLAFYLIIFIGLTLWKVRWSKVKIAWLILLAGEIFILINTFSLAGAILLAFLLLFLSMRAKLRYRIILVSVLTAFLAIFLGTNFGQVRISKVLQTMRDFPQMLETGESNSSLGWRILHGRTLLSQWREAPWFGYGLKAITIAGQRSAHNDYIGFLVELGIVGFSCFLGFLFLVGREIIRCYRKLPRGEIKDLSYLSLGLYGCWLIGSLSDNIMATASFQYYLWPILAVVSGISSNDNR